MEIMKIITSGAYALMLFVFLAGLSFIVTTPVFFITMASLMVLFAIAKSKPGEDKSKLVAGALLSFLRNMVVISAIILIVVLAISLWPSGINPHP